MFKYIKLFQATETIVFEGKCTVLVCLYFQIEVERFGLRDRARPTIFRRAFGGGRSVIDVQSLYDDEFFCFF